MSDTAGERQEERLQRENYHGDLPCIPLASSPLEGCFWFQLNMVDAEGEGKFWLQCLESEASQTHCFSLFLSVTLCFPSVFLSLSLTRMPLLAGGFVCFMPQREPSCTDVLPGLQFLAFAWSSLPSRTTGPDEELQRIHLAASHLTWGFCPQTPPPPLSHPECSFETREAARRGIHHCFGRGRYV